MAEVGVTLAQAKRELEVSQNEVSRCMAELEAAHASAKPELSTRVLKVTLLEVFGAISVDRVAVRSIGQPSQEKVVAEGIPSMFTIEVGVTVFDLVFMAEHASPAPQGDLVVGATSVSAGDVASNSKEQSVEVGKGGGGGEREEQDAGSTEQAACDGNEAGAVEARDEAQEVGGDEVMVEASDATPGASPTTMVSSNNSTDASSRDNGGSPPDTTPSASEDSRAAAAPAESAVAEKGEEHDVKGISDMEKPSLKANGDVGDGEGSLTAPSNTTGALNDAGRTVDAVNIASGCSTVTTEVVVPSSELNFDSPEGQWRYLDGDASPVAADETGPVEVATGVRFSTLIESQHDRDVDSRIVQLSSEYDAAEMRVKAAEALVEQLTPATATPSDRRPGNARKIVGKKSTKRKQDQSRATGAPRVRGPLSTLSGGLYKLYSNVGKPVVTMAWGMRNVMFFASAVAVMHYHGEYLSV